MNANILSIILYGSHAREDHDKFSDLDICILTKERQIEEIDMNDIKEMLAPLQPKQITASCYPESAVDSMLEYGSLFLWHLKLEGKVLYGENYFMGKIQGLNKFKKHQDEILYHLELFRDLKRTWDRLGIISESDLSLLFTIARNTCMVLSHYAGKPLFGRISCFSSAKQLFPNLPMDIDKYTYLSSWKIIYERDPNPQQPLPDLEQYRRMVSDVENLLEYTTKTIT